MSDLPLPEPPSPRADGKVPNASYGFTSESMTEDEIAAEDAAWEAAERWEELEAEVIDAAIAFADQGGYYDDIAESVAAQSRLLDAVAALEAARKG